MIKSTTDTRDHSIENELGKITNKHYIVILGATQKNKGIEKEW